MITGFVNSDDSSVVSGSPTLTTPATPSTVPGMYAITAGLGTLSAANYTFSPVVMRTAGGAPGDVTCTLNGAAPVALHGVTSFAFSGGAGNDTLTVSLANGAPLLRGAVRFAGGTGIDTLNLDAAGLPVRITP